MATVKHGMSVVVLGALLFIVMAFAVYVFRSFPYLLGAVLLAEWIILAVAVAGPLISSDMKKGWIGFLVSVLFALALANIYMLFLARAWGVDLFGWYRWTLMLQNTVVGLVVHAFQYVIRFLDAVLMALFGLKQAPIEDFVLGLWRRVAEALRAPLSIQAGDDLKLGLLINLVIGAAACLVSASVIRKIVPRSHGARPAERGH
jgi:hypothetical protein